MKVLFFVIMAPYFFLDLYLYGAWMYSRKRSLRSGNPTYQLAVIGNFFGANVASRVGEREVSLMLLAIGTVFYLLVFISIYQAISRDNVHHLTIPNLVDFDEEEEEEETAASGSESEKEESEEKKKTEEDVEVTAKKEDDGDGDGNMSDKHHSQLIAVPNQEHHHHHHNHHRNPHHGHHGHHGHHHHIEHDHHGDSHNRSHHHHHHHHGSRYHHRDHHNHSHHHHHHHRKSRCHGCNNDVDYYSETDTESSDENRHHHRHHHRHSSRHRRVRRRARDSHHKRRGSRSDVHSKVETTAETEEKEDDEKPRLSLERIKDDSEKALSALFNDGNVDLTADVFQSDDDDDQSANGILNQQALPERFLQTSSKDNHESGGSRIKQYIKSFSVDDCYLCERQYSLPPPLPPPLETDFCIDCEKNLKEDAATPAASPATSPKQRSPTKTYRPSSLAINQEVKIPTFRANLKPAVKPSPNLKRRPPPLMLRTQSCDARLLLSRSAALLSPVATPRSIATSQANSGVGDGTAIRVLLHSSPVFSRRAAAAAAAATTKISPLTPVLARRSRTMSTSSDALNAGTKTQTSTTNLATDRSSDEKDDKKPSEKAEGLERQQSTLVLYPPHHDRTEGENDEDHDGKFPNLHPSMHPVLFVFVAPPAAAALALSQYYGRNGMGAEVSDLSKACFFIALFLFLSIIRHLMLFVKDTPYSLSYWAYTFPIATLATSAINYSNSLSDVLAAQWLAFGIVAIATILILIVAGLTIYQVVAGRGVFPNDDVVGVCINTLANGGGGGSSGGRSDTASVYSSVSGSELGNSCSDSDSTLMGEEGHKKDRQGNDALPSLKKRRRRKRRENSAASDPAPVPADTVIEMEPPFLQGNHGNIALKLALSETSL